MRRISRAVAGGAARSLGADPVGARDVDVAMILLIDSGLATDVVGIAPTGRDVRRPRRRRCEA